MEVILKDDVKDLGYKHDLVTVKAGYGRNYLIPQGLALPATEGNKRAQAENARQMAHKAEKLKTEAERLSTDIAKALELNPLTLRTRAGESGKIFGKITSLQVSDALKERGFEVDRKRVDFTGDVKNLGEYDVNLNLHREVKMSIKISVVEE